MESKVVGEMRVFSTKFIHYAVYVYVYMHVSSYVSYLTFFSFNHGWQVKVISSQVLKGVRTVVMTRAFKGITPEHYTFDPATTSLPMINAVGDTVQLAFHKYRSSATLSLLALDAPTCVCNGGTKGTINGLPFNNVCAPEPTGDLLLQHNPTCSIQTYREYDLAALHP